MAYDARKPARDLNAAEFDARQPRNFEAKIKVGESPDACWVWRGAYGLFVAFRHADMFLTRNREGRWCLEVKRITWVVRRPPAGGRCSAATARADDALRRARARRAFSAHSAAAP